MNTKKKCPKCRSNNICFVELWKDHAIYFNVEDGNVDLNNGILEPGNPYKVEGHCNECKHIWTFRGASQIHEAV